MSTRAGNYVQDLRLPKNFHRELRFMRIHNKYKGAGVYAILLLWEWAADHCPTTGRLETITEQDIHTICCIPESQSEFTNDLIEFGFLDQENGGALSLPNWREEQPYVAKAEERSRAQSERASKRWETARQAKEMNRQCVGSASAVPKGCPNTNTKALNPPFPPTGGEGEGVLVRGVVELCAELLPELPKPEVTEKVRRDIEARAKADTERQGLEWWRGYFGRVRQCPHLMGGSSSGWRASLSWLVGRANMDKVLGGEYQQAPAESGQQQSEGWSLEEWERMQGGAKPDGPQ